MNRDGCQHPGVPQPSCLAPVPLTGKGCSCLAEQRFCLISDAAKPQPNPCHIRDPARPLMHLNPVTCPVLTNPLCQMPSHTGSATITDVPCSSSLAGESKRSSVSSYPTRLSAPTFGVLLRPVPRTPASPCSGPPGSPLLLGGRGWSAVHMHPSSTTLLREKEMSVCP